MGQFKDELLTRFDRVMVILQRLDHERLLTIGTIRRQQHDEQQQEINLIKRVLKVA